LLDVQSLNVSFEITGGQIHALRDVSLEVRKGETVGIAGESGSGKSTLALAVARHLDSNGRIQSGSIWFAGTDLRKVTQDELRSLRGARIAHVAQNAATALNPSLRIGEQISEAISLHQQAVSPENLTDKVQDVLDQVNLPEPAAIAERYPHELSGGQQQRALLAMGLSCNPELLILDEPTTGLDVTTQAKFLELVEELKSNYDAGIMLITHNLGVIAEVADRVNILYAGEILERGPVEEVFTKPANPYTQALLATTPEFASEKEIQSIPGRIPELDDIPGGCIFADRCSFATESCRSERIELETVSQATAHESRCHAWQEVVRNPIEVPETSSRARAQGDKILEVTDLRKYYDEASFVQRILGGHTPVKAVDGVSFSLHESEAVGLVGESGCGKSTLGRTLLNLHEARAGSVKYREEDVADFSKVELRQFRSECQIIFQDPERSLNPSRTVAQSIARPLKMFTDAGPEARQDRVNTLTEQLGLGRDITNKFPHELSGGQQQRVAIARAFAAEPSLIVLDEPVASLDVSVQANILNLLEKLRDVYNTSYLLISHDLSVIESICDRVAIMYLGKIIERGETSQIFSPPFHPYTRALLSGIPSLNPQKEHDRVRLEGDVPNARDPPEGCSFQTRCPRKIGEVCETEEPQLSPVAGEEASGHCLSCHLEAAELEQQTGFENE
jgi:peptide/nickel transport system ATP-binding protein